MLSAMIQEREVEPEQLDELPSDHPDAIESRNDLKRLNWWMGNAPRLAKEIGTWSAQAPVRAIVDLGGGDGALIADALERLGPNPNRERGVVRVVDRHPCISAANRQRLQEMGWEVETIEADAIEWLTGSSAPAIDVIVANLFLHHFPAGSLRDLLAAAAKRCHCFIASEPSRDRRSLLLSKAIWLIGCHPVTRNDAPISVRAGFRGKELSRLWPRRAGWSLQEHPFGLASHHFSARFQGGDG